MAAYIQIYSPDMDYRMIPRIIESLSKKIDGQSNITYITDTVSCQSSRISPVRPLGASQHPQNR